MRTRAVSVAAALAVVALAAGCGSGGGSKASGTTTATTTIRTTAAMQPACRRLNAATQQTVKELGATLSGFRSITSLGALAQHTTKLQSQLRSSSARIAAVDTPPGPLTRDKRQISSALTSLERRLAAARTAATSGHVGTATREFASLAQLTALRRAAASLARDCPHG